MPTMTNSVPCPRCGQDAVITAHRRTTEAIDTGKSLDFTFWCPSGHTVPESELMLMWRIPSDGDGDGDADPPDRRPHRPVPGRASRQPGRPGHRGTTPRHR